MSIQSDRHTSDHAPSWSGRLPERLADTDFARAFHRALDSDCLDLRTSNPTDVDLRTRQPCLDALRDGTARDSLETYRPNPAGALPARRAISAYYEARGADVPPDDIVLCASTSEAYTWLAKALGDPGDAFAVPTPSYPLFEHLLTLETLRTAPYNIQFDGRWHTDLASLRSVLQDSSIRAVIDVSPNNPTGHRLRADQLESVADILAEARLPLIVDEVFLDYNRRHAGSQSILRSLQQRAPTRRPPSIILSGLSKTAGLPGAKVGWIAIDGPESWRAEARRRLRFIADTFLSVTTASQLAIPDVLDATDDVHEELNARLARHSNRIDTLVDDLPVASRHSGDHGWYELIRLPHTIESRELAVDLAADHRVGVQPGFLYDLPETTLVVSLLPADDVFDEGVDRLHAGLRAAYTH